MGGEAGSKGGEPKGGIVGVGFEAVGEGVEDRGAGHVAMVGEDLAGLGEVERGELGFDGLNDIAAAGVGEDLLWIGEAATVEGGDGFCGEAGDRAVELVFEFSAGVFETDFFAVGG